MQGARTARPKPPSRVGARAPVERESDLRPFCATNGKGFNGLAAASPALTPHPLAAMHRAVGNQAVLRSLSALRPTIQSKLTINQLGDQYEQQADSMHGQVIQMPHPTVATSQAMSSVAPVLQRKCACGGSRRGSGQCSECAKKEELQRSAAGPAAVAEAPPIVHDVLRQAGRPLDASTRAFFEPRFGEDFTHVRLHHDALADRAATSVDALAFAVGNHVAFAEGAYSPATQSGRKLLAHELTHVLQQRPTDDSTANPLGQGQLGQAPVGPVRLQRQSPSGPPSARKELLPSSLGKFDENDRRRFRESVLDGQRVTGNRENDIAVLAERFICDTFPWADFDPDPLFCLDSAVTRSRPVFSKYRAEVIEPEYDKTLPNCIAISRQPQSKAFFGQPIPSESSVTLRRLLLEAQVEARRTMCLNGIDPNAYQLDRNITTYATHSPGMDQAVDVDVMGQPYIMHETQWVPKIENGKTVVDKDGKVVKIPVPETDIDAELASVYNRITYWTRYRQSIIPRGITTVRSGGSNTDRSWTNPNTALSESISTGQLYDLLQQESTGMQEYFNLLLASDPILNGAVEAFITFSPDPSGIAASKFGLPRDLSPVSVQAFRQRIADDYRLLGGSWDQLRAFAGAPIANISRAPEKLFGDRPFEGGTPAGSGVETRNRRPELGFITLPKEIVVALTEVGLTWGAIDFGGSSGDVMHFDCRKFSDCKTIPPATSTNKKLLPNK